MEIVKIKIADLTENKDNVKLHPQDQIAQIKASIQEFGFNDPVAVDEKGVLIEGHGRLEALKQLGYEEVEAIRLTHLTPDQKRAYVIAHNKLTINTGFDEKKLIEELDKLASIELGFSITGFTKEEIDAMKDRENASNAREDGFSPVIQDAEPFSRAGDLWILGGHRLVCGDSTKRESYDALFETPEQLADLVITDPPYNVDYSSKNEFLNNSDKGNRIETDIENDNMDNAKFREFIRDAFSNVSIRLREGGSFYSFYADKVTEANILGLRDAGLDFRQILVWVKNNAVLGRSDYKYKHEPILYGWKKGAAHNFNGDYAQNSVIEAFPTEALNKKSKKELLEMVKELRESQSASTDTIYADKPLSSELHPTMKPVRLLSRLVHNSSDREEIVLDIFAGSGSTLIACEQLGRRSFNIELDGRYCDAIVSRFRKYANNDDTKIKLIRDGQELSISDSGFLEHIQG
jgi:DNA modification methylase